MNEENEIENNSSMIDIESVETEQDSELLIHSEPSLNNSISNDVNNADEKSKSNNFKHVRLPLARVKHIMKMDPDCHLINQDAVFLVVKATEFFLEYMGKESYKQSTGNKRKTILRRDVDNVIDSVPHLCFLDGALE